VAVFGAIVRARSPSRQKFSLLISKKFAGFDFNAVSTTIANDWSIFL
jgi:hypothetical protein